ncbi:hypothetical protein EZV62_024479 [Acer yangbiense]|uniref:Zinc knuckle CX2CX4HX4C domain-containing protein n=1 Tax=Acer yangbiense TaxID=1000413 RepID=A0A5C7GUY6_9ROSI|nr:hypothetical protein EZV62_024479 [Acer yangbiense]
MEHLRYVEDIDVGVTGECFGKYMRLKVAIDVSKPLKRFLRVELLEKGTESLLLLCYEKLTEYCFHCGIIGHSHTHRECHNRKDGDIRGLDTDFEYGSWMRTTSPPVVGADVEIRLESEGVKGKGVDLYGDSTLHGEFVDANMAANDYNTMHEKQVDLDTGKNFSFSVGKLVVDHDEGPGESHFDNNPCVVSETGQKKGKWKW